MTLHKFNNKYRYVSDTKLYSVTEYWTCMKENPSGFFEGDCEDYCLGLIEYVEGFEDLKLIYGYLNGDGHIVGELNGLYIDCNHKKLVKREAMPRFHEEYNVGIIHKGIKFIKARLADIYIYIKGYFG